MELYLKSRRSKIKGKGQLRALTGPLHTAGIGWIEFAQMISQR